VHSQNSNDVIEWCRRASLQVVVGGPHQWEAEYRNRDHGQEHVAVFGDYGAGCNRF
jgi:hypothetical protein